MNKRFTITVLTIFGLSTIAGADRDMTSNEVTQLLETLTSQPRLTWLTKGKVRARHLEYTEVNNTVVESEEVFIIDGEKYTWEITVEEDSGSQMLPEIVETQAGQAQHVSNSDKKRIFTWDGSQYTRYFKSSGYAMVALDSQDMPIQVFGPLSAGVIPWGHGDFQLSTLTQLEPAAIERGTGDEQRIELTLIKHQIHPALTITIRLNPLRNYAVEWYRWRNDQASIEYTLSDYTQINLKWMPQRIRVERTDLRDTEPKLLSYDDWFYEEISSDLPPTDPFQTKFSNGTLVEMQLPNHPQTLLYHAFDEANVSELINDKISMLTADQQEQNNCATAAIRHLIKRYNRPEPDQQMAELVSAETRLTSLQKVKQALEESELYCSAIQTDLETLKTIDNCSGILHIPINNHYVILDHIDAEYVWTIDLTSRKFYWKTPIKDFLNQWEDGTVLLVTESPIYLPSGLNNIETEQLLMIQGGGNYSCSEIIQTETVENCPEPLGGLICRGSYRMFWQRKGCIEDSEGGLCHGIGMLGYSFSRCIEDQEVTGQCIYFGKWYKRDIRACE